MLFSFPVFSSVRSYFLFGILRLLWFNVLHFFSFRFSSKSDFHQLYSLSLLPWLLLGTVVIAVNHLPTLDMLDALHAVVVPNISPNQVPFMLFPSCQSVPFLLLFLHHKVSPNVILAVFRCHLATISPAVWNAEIAEGTCPPDLRHWLLGHVLPNGLPVNFDLVAWMWSATTVAPFIGELR